MTKLNKIDGFQAILAQRLASLSIETLDDLLMAGKTKAERKSLAKKARVTTRTITHWVTIADLIRVNGIHIKYAKLLQSAGLKTLQDLAEADPHNLHALMEATNRNGHRQVSRVPAVSRVTSWIEEAQNTTVKMEMATSRTMLQLQ